MFQHALAVISAIFSRFLGSRQAFADAFRIREAATLPEAVYALCALTSVVAAGFGGLALNDWRGR